ncbi:MAG TPA: flagellar basal body-associated FliL family protein [Nocardioidaceae bacterium]|nr:flagellar basal body-associated FliL family protein [Nocardioidaceae bacterium]
MTVTTMPPTAAETAEAGKGKNRKKLLIGAVLLVAVAAAGWWFLLRPTGPAEPEPGAVLTLEPIQLNLAAGHYLKVGIALQGVAEAEEELDGSKALDATIDLFSGKRMEDITQPVQRDKLKQALLRELTERYHGEVLDVYFTEFVTQ